MAEPSSENEAQIAFMCQFCDQQNVRWKCEDCGVYLCSLCKEKIHPRLKSSAKHNIIYIQDIGKGQCYDNEPWYHGRITRKEAVELLQKHKYMGHGVFLVRESESDIGSFALDFLVDDEPRHVKIQPREVVGQLKFTSGNDRVFDSVKNLIEFYKCNLLTNSKTGTEFKLTEPILKEM